MGKHNFKFRAFSRISTARWKRLVRGCVPRAFPIGRLVAACLSEFLAAKKNLLRIIWVRPAIMGDQGCLLCPRSSPFLSRAEYLGAALLSLILIFNLFTGHLRFGTMRRPSRVTGDGIIHKDRSGSRARGAGGIPRVLSGFRAPSKRPLDIFG